MCKPQSAPHRAIAHDTDYLPSPPRAGTPSREDLHKRTGPSPHPRPPKEFQEAQLRAETTEILAVSTTRLAHDPARRSQRAARNGAETRWIAPADANS